MAKIKQKWCKNSIKLTQNSKQKWCKKLDNVMAKNIEQIWKNPKNEAKINLIWHKQSNNTKIEKIKKKIETTEITTKWCKK